MFFHLNQLDFLITQKIFELPRNKILNLFFDFFSAKEWWIVIWFGIFFCLFYIEEKKRKNFFIFFISGLLISSILTNIILKNIFKRPRPFSPVSNFQSLISQKKDHINILISNYPTDFSFPSGHATLSFSAASMLSFFDKKRKKLFYLFAFLVAFSRIYLGYHYFFDVLIGSFLGWLTTKTILFIGNLNNKNKIKL